MPDLQDEIERIAVKYICCGHDRWRWEAMISEVCRDCVRVSETPKVRQIIRDVGAYVRERETPYSAANYDDPLRLADLAVFIEHMVRDQLSRSRSPSPAVLQVSTADRDRLIRQVFATISTRFRSRVDELFEFVKTGCSFEEWCNWEAFGACMQVDGWDVQPRPAYRTLTDLPSNDFGDLLITERSSLLSVLVEVGLVHDQTGDKWIEKLDWDMHKLSLSFRPNVIPLQVILLTSAARIERAANWEKWLGRATCWVRPTDLSTTWMIGASGQAILRGWVGTRCT